MAIVKRGECKGSVVVSKTLYSCSSCGHAEVSSNNDADGMKCPKCGAAMDVHCNGENQDDHQNA